MVYLKAIESHGFKSFADKVTIQFDRGVTGVVGPNGSGKSNITDAIRWVLGEQSAKTMRGSTMQDVIFSGSDSRKPLNSAYVKLILSNESRSLKVERNEVHIQRKLYRNGDSEYYLNNEKCRLKEITELFMDSGLGKSAYNIISQGEVDQVLKAKPEDRRHLIEEAAGVMKYKSRKKESESKLDDTIENLSRLNDIISELFGQREQLGHEREVALEYQALYETMARSDIEVTVHDIEQLSNSLLQTETSIRDNEDKLSNYEQNIQQLNSEISTLEEESERLNESRTSMQNARVTASRLAEQLSGNIQLYKERKENQTKASDNLHKEQSRIETRLRDTEAMIKQRRDEKKQLASQLKAIKNEEKHTINERDAYIEDDASEIESLRDAFFELSVQKTTAENDMKEREKEVERRDSFLSQRRTRLESTRAALEAAQSAYESTRAEHEQWQSEYELLKHQAQEKHAALVAEEEQFLASEARVQKGERYLENEVSRLEMLNTLADEYKGFYPGVRAVLKARNKLQGIDGAVGELFTVPTQYVVALDTALGAVSQHIVVESEASAKAGIDYLRQSRNGFATFLPLDTIQARALNETVKRTLKSSNIEAYVLSDLVTYDDVYTPVANHLLRTTLICKSIDDATKLAKLLKYRVKIVTLQGETLMPGGAMSGGSKAKQTSVVEMKNEVETLSQTIARYQGELVEFKADKDAHEKTYKTLQNSYTSLQNRMSALAENIEEKKQALTGLDMRRENLEDTIQSLEYDLDESEESDAETVDISSIDKELETIRARIHMLSASDEEKRDKIQALNDALNKLLREQDKVRIHLDNTTADLNELETEYEALLAAVKENEAQIALLSEDLSLINIDELAADKADQEEEIICLESQLEENAQSLSTIKDSIRTFTTDKNKAEESIHELNQKLRVASGHREKIDTQLETKVAYLENEYKTTYEKERESFESLTDIEEKRRSVRLNKRTIEALGPVNLNSIEAYDAVDERYTFLKAQETDLLDAHATLKEIIRDMDREVSTRFKAVYEQVNAHFGDVFREMFGGGRAELRLTIPDDYLESGIEILAEPPGKRLSSLSLLSGGERALTTISLLFSILKVRVSPFVILDEVEAALDEANVLRFSRYLKTLAKDTQFIVITHRKGTMEHSDRLFGLTMAEQGVTSIISVDLNNYEEVIGEK